MRETAVDSMPSIQDWRRMQKFVEYDTNGGCWLWSGTGTKREDGYGMFYLTHPKRCAPTHRIFYTRLKGPIPDGLWLDHLCRVKRCCNPNHLEPVTPRENLARAPNFNGDRTHCPKGHEYTPKNTRVKVSKKGYSLRDCKACHAERSLAVYWANRTKIMARRRELARARQPI